MAAWCRRSRRAPISTISTGWCARALDEAGVGLGDIDGVAAAGRAGADRRADRRHDGGEGHRLGRRSKPFIAVNHLEAHALTARLSDDVAFPYLLLLVSGGHSQLLVCAGVGRFVQLGTSRDDAAGEAFDKSGQAAGAPQPGGPAIERAARGGDPRRFALPRPLKGRERLRFLVFRAEDRGARTGRDALAARRRRCRRPRRRGRTGDLRRAGRPHRQRDRVVPRHYPEGRTLVAAGGVAANARLARPPRRAGRRVPGSLSSRRRRRCAPITAR